MTERECGRTVAVGRRPGDRSYEGPELRNPPQTCMKGRKKDDLRKRAEARLQPEPEELDDLSPEEVRKLVRELRTHQIDLELQNEELRTAQQELADSRDRYLDLYEQVTDSTIVTDAEFRIIYVNRAAEELFGYRREELLGQTPDLLNAEPMAAKIQQEVYETVSTGEPYLGTCLNRRKDGSTFTCEFRASPIRDEKGETTGHVGVQRDITERKRAEEALRLSEQRFRLLVESSYDGISIAHRESLEDRSKRKLLYCNERFVKMSGRSREELMATDDLSEFLSDRTPRQGKPDDTVKLRAGLAAEGVASWKRPDGRENCFEWVAVPLMLDEELHIISIDRDVTERRRVEAELAGQRRGLRRVFARLIDAHEDERKSISRELHDGMGQALTAMQINLAEIGKALPPECPSEARERLAETRSLVEETLEQVRELAQGLRPGMLDDLGLVPTVRWYTNQFRKRLGIAGDLEALGLEERLTSDTEVVLYRAVQEALTNVARHAKANRVKIRLERKDSAVVALVEDDGSGFDTAALEEPGALERGLGLLGMRERASALDGTVTIESRPGHGTRLLIEIPVAEGRAFP